MKFRPVYIAIIFVLLVIVFMASSTGSSYVPYMKTSHFDQAFPYEGMSNLKTRFAGTELASSVVSDKPTAPAKESYKNCAKVEGFALQPSPTSASELIDRYGKTPGEPSCFGKSMGYSRSTGPLCFTEEDLKLLTTRGGNMGGRDSVIGQPM
jgi:hypothetical protein